MVGREGERLERNISTTGVAELKSAIYGLGLGGVRRDSLSGIDVDKLPAETSKGNEKYLSR